MTDVQWEAQHKVFQKAGLLFQNLPCPTIVAANGHAFGGGFEFVCLADWSVANENALFRFPEVRLGIFPGLGGGTAPPTPTPDFWGGGTRSQGSHWRLRGHRHAERGK